MEQPDKKSIRWGAGLLALLGELLYGVASLFVWIFGRIVAFLKWLGNLLPF